MGLTHAKAQALAKELFGPDAKVMRGKDSKGTWRWAILFPPKPPDRLEWVVAGSGGTYEEMFADAKGRLQSAMAKHENKFKGVLGPPKRAVYWLWWGVIVRAAKWIAGLFRRG